MLHEKASRVYIQFDESKQDATLHSCVLRWAILEPYIEVHLSSQCPYSAMSELKKDCDLYEREAEATKWSLENMEAEHSFNTDLSASLLHENFQEAAQIRKMAEELKR